MSNIFISAEYLDDDLIKKQIKHIIKNYKLRQIVYNKHVYFGNQINKKKHHEIYYRQDFTMLNDEYYDYGKYEKEDEFRELDENEDFYEFRMLFKCKKYMEYLDNEYYEYMKINRLEIIPKEDLDCEKMKIIGYILDVDEIIVKYI